ncbi:MAG: hypothetical protein QW347_02950 [Candidatus Nitrosocaldus sp.]
MRKVSNDDYHDDHSHVNSNKSAAGVDMGKRIRKMEGKGIDEKAKSNSSNGKERGATRDSNARIKRLIRQLLIELGEDPN